MKEIIPAVIFLAICFTTFFLSNFWLQKHDSSRKIESISNEKKMNYENFINTHAKNVKIGSIILIIITVFKIIHMVINE